MEKLPRLLVTVEERVYSLPVTSTFLDLRKAISRVFNKPNYEFVAGKKTIDKDSEEYITLSQFFGSDMKVELSLKYYESETVDGIIEPTIHMASGNYLYIYNIKTHKCRKYKCAELEGKDQDNCGGVTIYVGKHYYLIGGSFTYVFKLAEDLGTASLIAKAPPNSNKDCTKLIAYLDKYIFAIGNDSPNCEYYNIHDNVWEKMPQPQAHRHPALSIVGNKYLFMIGGSLTEIVQKLDIESLVMHNKQVIWEEMEIAIGLLPKQYCWESVAIDEGHLLIFGGGTGAPKGYSKNAAYLLDIGTRSVRNASSMKNNDHFWGRRAVKCEGKVFAISQHMGALHVYDISDQSWDMVPFKVWSESQPILI
eukprot:TRINITY_DN1041_c0_g1_i1.p2 TRINITY_DN1041_c0_g1~~TRINITY_DN1041_c0_g1_i1.p2  ORF type:complete len:364 (+),score=30.51 TRINITY_DN1041_c0_g1_i1:1318-2409(+)